MSCSNDRHRRGVAAFVRVAALLGLLGLLGLGAAGCPEGHGPGPDAGGPDALCGPGDATGLPEGRLVVATEQYGSGGGITVIDLDTLEPDINVALTSDDVTPRWWDGRLWVLNRYGGDNVTLLDGRDFHLIRQLSLRPGAGLPCNPHDLAFLSTCRLYVTCFDQAAVYIVDPTAPLGSTFVGEIDLASLADGDGLPEVSHLARVGDRVYASVERLDRQTTWGPVAPSYVAVLDPASDALEEVIVLEGQNPVGPLRHLGDSADLVVTVSGPWDGSGAGLERVDTLGRASSLALGAAELGGIPTAFTLDATGCGFAVVTEPGTFDTGVVRYCLGGGVTSCVPLGERKVSDVALDARGRLWVTDRDLTAPGLRLYDAARCVELTTETLPTGFAPGFTNPLLLIPRRDEAALTP